MKINYLWISLVIVILIFLVVYFSIKYMQEHRKPLGSPTKLKSYYRNLIHFVAIELIFTVVTTFGASALDYPAGSPPEAKPAVPYLEEIDTAFNEKYTTLEMEYCYAIVLEYIQDASLSRVANYNETTSDVPNKKIPKDEEDFEKAVKYWKRRCSGSKNPECYRQYASIACDYVKYLRQHNKSNKKITDTAETSINNYRKFLTYNGITPERKSDTFYRIAQVTNELSMLNNADEQYTAKMHMLTTIYYQLAYDYCVEGSVYYDDIPYYLAESYEAIAVLANSKDSLIWLSKAIDYCNVVNKGKGKVNEKLYSLYYEMAEYEEKFNSTDTTHKSAEEYREIGNQYKDKAN